MNAVWRREFLTMLASPIGWVVLAGFAVAMTVLGVFIMPQTGGADWFAARDLNMSSFFASFPWAAAVFLPAVSMRAWSEDLRSGTWQLLATFPIPLWRVVAGKFLAAGCFLVLMLSATVGWPIMVLTAQAAEGIPVEIGPIIGGYLGCLMLGGAFIAIGMLISGLTMSQTGAYVASLLICGALVGWRQFVGVAPEDAGALLSAALNYISVEGHFGPVARGHLRLDGLLWYASITLVALFANAQVMEWRRYRP